MLSRLQSEGSITPPARAASRTLPAGSAALVLAAVATFAPAIAARAPAAGAGPRDAAPAAARQAPPSASPRPSPTLAGRLAAHLNAPILSPEDTGAAVLLLPRGQGVSFRNADRPLKPASTVKILTSAAALALLKPEFVFETRILADAPIDGAGTIAGNLYLQGFGAPDLVGESWWLMARRLAALGLRRVDGDLVADDTYFDAVRRPAGWPAPGADSWYNAPVGALTCNFNVVTVRVDPSPILGTRPDITLEPISSYFQVLNRATTAAGPASLQVTRDYDGGRNSLTVSGTIRRGGGPLIFHRAVEDPPLYAAHAFREIARREGIEIRGGIVGGAVPEKAREIHRHESRPLAALLRDMNKNSNNFMAEALLKTLGAQFIGTPGTTSGGLEVVRTYLSGIGVDAAGARLADGSGLSEDNLVPARLLAGVLARAWNDFEIGPDLAASFPVGGADGTLDARFGGEEGRRRVRAKTGRIAGALTLAGYAANRDGRLFAFAVLANRPRGTIEAVHRAIDRFVEEIVSSTDADLAAPAD
jgi:D-alanyl-D-alanine carboxypeptidase/D-alanyl-D-alanine-endopeptidase (penicillin-binding protein 4)